MTADTSTLPPADAKQGSTDPKPKPTLWWQWVLVYPALAISIMGSIPTYIELVGSKILGVPFGDYRVAVRENQLWQENISCAAAPFDGLQTKQKIEVDAVVCLSGNVLVRVNPPGSQTAYKWVPLDSVKRADSGFSLISTAHAVPRAPSQSLPQDGIVLAQANYQVMCQQWVGNGLIRRVILNRAINACFAEVVNTFSGQVVNSSPAACSC
jgi:hypothetical protein